MAAPPAPAASEPARPGGRERSLRVTEAVLLLLALLTFFAGGALALLSKTPPGGDKAASALVNLNAATLTQFAALLHVPAVTAERIVSERTKDGKEGFSDVDALARLRPKNAAGTRESLVPPASYAAAKSRFVVRSPEAARAAFLGWGGAVAAFFIAAHLLIRLTHPRADPFLLPVAAFLCTLSLLMLWSLKDPLRDRLAFVPQAQGMIFGGALALTFALSPLFGRAPLHRYGYVYALAAVAGCVLLGFAGSGPGGVHLNVGGVQPVEGIKVLLVFFLAAYLAERAALLDDPLRSVLGFPVPRGKDVLPLLVMYALPLALFGIVRDLGPALLLFGIFVILLYLATGRGAYVGAGLLLIVVGGFFGYKLHFGVFATRLDMWLHPYNNPHPTGDHLALGLWGMASGGPLGSGWGLGGSHFIPRGGSDLALASLGEDSGVFGTVAVLLCGLIIVARGFVIARRAATDFDRYLAAGLAGLWGLQTLLIASGTLGLFPLSGVTVPFVSFGKSSLVASLFTVGVLLHLSSRVPPGAAALHPLPPVWERASRRVGLFFFLTLGVACIARAVYVQVLAPDLLATRTVSVPDADKVKRAHTNPRLLLLAARITRGRILDRNGIILAETRPDGTRFYPLGAAAGHLVGYLDPAVGGPVGIERSANAPLRGYTTAASLLPYWRGKDLPGFKLPQGKDVTLTLDAALQTACFDALKRGTAKLRDHRTGQAKQRGAVVVLDVATGGVLAAVTLPAYDPNALTPATMRFLSANLDHDFPLVNRATGGYYPPGSTFKIVSASALFAANAADFTYDCRHEDRNVKWTSGGKSYSRRRVVDDEGDRPHGGTNIETAVAQSCNVYFARAGIRLGAPALRDHAAHYGFARLPTLSQFDAALPEIAFGQGEMLATPLEMAQVALTVANGGKRLSARFRQDAPITVADTPLTPPNAARLSEMMRCVTESGTAARRFDDLSFTVAGKTGTAQNNQNDRAPHSWFIGFAPADRPRYAFAVLAENGGYGAQTAVPIARAVVGKLPR